MVVVVVEDVFLAVALALEFVVVLVLVVVVLVLVLVRAIAIFDVAAGFVFNIILFLVGSVVNTSIDTKNRTNRHQ